MIAYLTTLATTSYGLTNCESLNRSKSLANFLGYTIVSPTLMVLSVPVGIDRTIPFAKSDSTSLV